MAVAFVIGARSQRAEAQANDLVWTAQLGGVEGSGSKRIPSSLVASIAGLKLGSTIGPKDVEAARQRLLQSRFFTSVGFRFRTAGYTVIVTFTLEDVAWRTPVVFDNFVDHTDAQLIAAVARDVPSFAGLAPDEEAVLTRISSALERIAREAKDPGTVRAKMMIGASTKDHQYQFRIERASGPLPVCAVAFDGVSEATVPALTERKAALLLDDYSRETIRTLAKELLAPVLPAPLSIRQIDARRAPVTEACPRGVAVTISVR
jgi:hypothetical protein